MMIFLGLLIRMVDPLVPEGSAADVFICWDGPNFQRLLQVVHIYFSLTISYILHESEAFICKIQVLDQNHSLPAHINPPIMANSSDDKINQIYLEATACSVGVPEAG